LQAVGHEAEEDVGCDALFSLVIDRADGEVAFEFFEGLFALGELAVVFPEFDWIAVGELGA
jgi:hypothetical protein